MEKIKVIVVDDHPIFRTGLCLLLNELSNVEIIGQAADGNEFLSLLNGHRPDIVFMDIKMPKMNGIEATMQALQRFPDLRIIALSMHEEEEYLNSMLQAGARGFLLKKVKPDDLEKAIEAVMDGGTFYSQELMALFTRKMIHAEDDEQVKFSAREREIIKYLCQGMSNHEIADKLFLSPRTVENHRANLLEKTNSKNTISLVIYSIKNRFVAV